MLWWFDAVGPGAAWALHCSLAVDAATATWWTVLARVDAPLIVVRDESLAAPRRGTLEVRGSGLWADVHCHEPMQRWQVNFEGIALALDDPRDVGGRELGDQIAIEFEFEFDAIAPATAIPGGYVQRCVADGELQFGSGETLALDAPTSGSMGHRG